MDQHIEPERRRRDERRNQNDRRACQEAYVGLDRRANEDRRTGDRRSKVQIHAEYEAAVDKAKAALLKHGMSSSEFGDAEKVTSELRRELTGFDQLNNLSPPSRASHQWKP